MFGALPTLPGDDGGQVAESIAELARGANYVLRVSGEGCAAA